MKIPLYQIDAFTGALFSGNPAAVCLLEDWPDDALLQSIAAENNLSETAFCVPRETTSSCAGLRRAPRWRCADTRRWPRRMFCFSGAAGRPRACAFSPAKAARLRSPAGATFWKWIFRRGPCVRKARWLSCLRLWASSPRPFFSSEEDLMVLLDQEKTVRRVAPDFAELETIECRGVIVTAPGDACDFVSRFFAPRVGIPEDPVTGSRHSVLVPYWSERLRKTDLYARQVSARGGELFCRHWADGWLLRAVRSCIWKETSLFDYSVLAANRKVLFCST